MQQFEVYAVIHSLTNEEKYIDLATIIGQDKNHSDNSNYVIAEYKGKKCTAVYNPFVGRYYVDDVYGILPDNYEV